MLKHDVMMNTNNERIGENYLLLIFVLSIITVQS